MPTYVRVVNQQVVSRSIQIDKIDRSQGNFEGYAQKAKQAIYVPLKNPLDTSVKGYIDMVPTDEVLLSLASGTLKGLSNRGYITTTLFNSSTTATPVVSGASVSNSNFVITGTTLASLSPDVSYVTITNLSNVTQTFPVGADLAALIALVNELKTDFTAHRTQASVHSNNDSTNTTAAPAATDLASAITLINELKTDFNAHRTQATVHGSNDSTNVVSSTNATTLATAIILANELKADYTAHIANVTFHSQADATNTVSSASVTSVTSTQIVIPASSITGTPTTNWKVQVKANSKNSAIVTL